MCRLQRERQKMIIDIRHNDKDYRIKIVAFEKIGEDEFEEVEEENLTWQLEHKAREEKLNETE